MGGKKYFGADKGDRVFRFQVLAGLRAVRSKKTKPLRAEEIKRRCEDFNQQGDISANNLFAYRFSLNWKRAVNNAFLFYLKFIFLKRESFTSLLGCLFRKHLITSFSLLLKSQEVTLK